MKIVAMIPARYAASRFPGKLMKMLGDKTVIRHTHDNTLATGLFDEVWIVTDSDIIYEEIVSAGGKAVMSKREHESGSDRIAEVVTDMDVEIVVNVQGDTPFVDKTAMQQLVHLFEDKTVQVGSMMLPITDKELLHNPNVVKVVTDKQMNSLFFSRSVIPFIRNEAAKVEHYEHVGIYAFRKEALLSFTKWPITPLEDAEKLSACVFGTWYSATHG